MNLKSNVEGCDIVFLRANQFRMVCPFHFYDICNPIRVDSGYYTGKVSVIFMISVTNLHFSEIEGSGPKSLPEKRIDGESKNTICCGFEHISVSF